MPKRQRGEKMSPEEAAALVARLKSGKNKKKKEELQRQMDNILAMSNKYAYPGEIINVEPKVKIPKEKKIRYSLGKERKILNIEKNKKIKKDVDNLSLEFNKDIKKLNSDILKEVSRANLMLYKFAVVHKIPIEKVKRFSAPEYAAMIKRRINKRSKPALLTYEP